MLMRISKKGQTVTEYAILLGIVISAIAGMQVYLRRGLQARFKTGSDLLTSPAATLSAGGGEFTANLRSLSQYDPYYQASVSETYQESSEDIDIADGTYTYGSTQVSGSGAGGLRGEIGGEAARAAADALWGVIDQDE